MLHVIAWMRNPLFADASVSVRASLVRDSATAFQSDCETLLAGSSYARKRRRIYDNIGALLHGTPLKDDERTDVIGALAHLSGLQLLVVKQPTTVEPVVATAEVPAALVELPTVTFSSSPVTWSSSAPTWVVDWHGRWVADSAAPLEELLSWALHLDPLAWHVQWPVVDATKEAIVQELSTTDSWKATDAKLKKEVLALRLGRIRVLRTLTH